MSKLKGWNLLEKRINISSYHQKERGLHHFFSAEDHSVFCTDIESLMGELGHHHNLKVWRLFIHSSELSLKAIPLHICNGKPSIQLACAAQMKERSMTT